MPRVMMQLTQPHHDADGNVLHQPGARFDPADRLVAELPPGSFKPVIVDGEPEPEPEPEPEAPAPPPPPPRSAAKTTAAK